jgi:hypothetical protein
VLLSATWSDRRLPADSDARLRRYVEGDQGFRVADADPATRAWAAVLAAEVHAARGRTEECLRALDEASALLPEATSRRYPWPDADWLAGERGVSLARLGRNAEARQALSGAIARTGDERSVDRLRWALALARTHARDGEPEQAARLAQGVLRAARQLRHGQLEEEAGVLLGGR